MKHMNILEIKKDLIEIIKILENLSIDSMYLVRDGEDIAQITKIPNKKKISIIGIAKGKIEIPNEFDEWDKEVEEMFENQ